MQNLAVEKEKQKSSVSESVCYVGALVLLVPGGVYTPLSFGVIADVPFDNVCVRGRCGCQLPGSQGQVFLLCCLQQPYLNLQNELYNSFLARKEDQQSQRKSTAVWTKKILMTSECCSCGFVLFLIFFMILLNTDETKHSSVPDNTFFSHFWNPSLSDPQYFGHRFRQTRLMVFILLLFRCMEGEDKRRLVTENT